MNSPGVFSYVRVIGQNVLVKTVAIVDISSITEAISSCKAICFGEIDRIRPRLRFQIAGHHTK